MIKGGAAPETIFNTIKKMMANGKTIDQAISQVESILRSKLPEHILDLIRQECR